MTPSVSLWCGPGSDLVTVARESMATFLADARPALAQHWRELGPAVPFRLDEAHYAAAEAADKLVIVTIRCVGHLWGYVIFCLADHPQSGQRQAIEQALYVRPSARGQGLGARLLRESDDVLRRLGCQMVYHAVLPTAPVLAHVLQRGGYRVIETTYGKEL